MSDTHDEIGGRPGGRGRALAAVLAVILLMRVGVLLGSQRWLHWDECIIGLTAKDVLRGNLHAYFPGQAYGGGAGIASLVIAALYLPLGVSPWAVKLYALAVTMATAVVIGLFVQRVWGERAACWACLLWATAPGLAIFALQVRAGYIEIQLLAAAVLLLFYLAAMTPQGKLGHFVGLGIACGLAYYSFSLSLPLLAAVFLVALAWDKLFWARPRWLAALSGLILGLGPMILYDVTHRFAHLRWALFMREKAGDEGLPARLWQTISFKLPNFFQPQIDDYLPAVPWYAWAMAALTALLTLLWLWQSGRDARIVLRHAPSLDPRPTPWPAGLETAMLLSLGLYFILCLAGPLTSARYFVGLHPVWGIGLGLAVGRAGIGQPLRPEVSPSPRPSPWEGEGGGFPVVKLLGAGLVLGGLLVNVHLMNLPGLREILGRPVLREGRVAVEPGAIRPVLDWLVLRDVRNVFCHPIIKWKLMFYSNETIRGLSTFSTNRDDDKIIAYAEAALADVLQGGQPCAFVFHKSFAYEGPDGGRVGVAGPVAILGDTDEHVMNAWTRIGMPQRPTMIPYRQFLEDTLRQAGIAWETEPLGDYVIWHNFQGGSAPAAILARLTAWMRPR